MSVENPFVFPQVHQPQQGRSGRLAPGLGLRDYLAARAPITIEDARASCDGYLNFLEPRDRSFLLRALAGLRYEYADAMLAERAKGGAA